jgi:hypothetical protein
MINSPILRNTTGLHRTILDSTETIPDFTKTILDSTETISDLVGTIPLSHMTSHGVSE